MSNFFHGSERLYPNVYQLGDDDNNDEVDNNDNNDDDDDEDNDDENVSLQVDLEEEMQSSLLLARRHGQERLDTERRRHQDIIQAMEREVGTLTLKLCNFET